MPRFGGPATMMRLPSQPTAAGLDACFVGVPMDSGTSYRSGTRFGPRQIRQESALLRPCNVSTGQAPFSRMQVADIGDVPLNPYNLKEAVQDITAFYREQVFAFDALPLSLGGDHTLTLPILRAVAEKHGPVGGGGRFCILTRTPMQTTACLARHLHTARFFGGRWKKGFYCATRCGKSVLRGSGYADDDWRWGEEQGFCVIPATECWRRELTPLLAKIRQKTAAAAVYLSFDIDSLDPAFAPGTGTPEIAGLTPWQALEIVRGCEGLNLVGCDLVEVSPPYDFCGNTALCAANLLFEMLCVLPHNKK